MPGVTFQLRGPDARLAGKQIKNLNTRIVKLSAIAVENEVVRRSPVLFGDLSSAWELKFIREKGQQIALVINNIHYIYYVIRGTWLYGPYHQIIKPKKSSVLVFSIGGTTIFSRWSRGQRPNDFVDVALIAVRPEIDAIIKRETRLWYKPGVKKRLR